jgi:hypothetical protein
MAGRAERYSADERPAAGRPRGIRGGDGPPSEGGGRDGERPPTKGGGKAAGSVDSLFLVHVGAEIAVFGTGFAVLYKQINDLRTKIEPVANDNVNLAQYVSLLEQKHADAIMQQHTLVGELKEEVRKSKLRGQAMVEHLNKLATAHNNLSTTVGELKAENLHLQNQLGSLQEQFSNFQGKADRTRVLAVPPRVEERPVRSQSTKPTSRREFRETKDNEAEAQHSDAASDPELEERVRLAERRRKKHGTTERRQLEEAPVARPARTEKKQPPAEAPSDEAGSGAEAPPPVVKPKRSSKRAGSSSKAVEAEGASIQELAAKLRREAGGSDASDAD